MKGRTDEEGDDLVGDKRVDDAGWRDERERSGSERHGTPQERTMIEEILESENPDGSQRPMGIPTVLDRVIQQAVAQVLGPFFEADFSEYSYGYRPGRSAHQAVAAMETGWKEGRRHAVECDLKSFFDTVNHDRLMNAIKGKVRCRRTLGLIRRYLTAGVVLPPWLTESTLSQSRGPDSIMVIFAILRF